MLCCLDKLSLTDILIKPVYPALFIFAIMIVNTEGAIDLFDLLRIFSNSANQSMVL